MSTMLTSAGSEVFFQNLIIYFLDTLILYLIFLIIKINNFRGDLSDISAKTATLSAGDQQVQPEGQLLRIWLG